MNKYELNGKNHNKNKDNIKFNINKYYIIIIFFFNFHTMWYAWDRFICR